ncbi:DUF2520 domain-containing protein [Fulvivirga sp. RKSG066]|uniref:Rossmann-like and DUF2520 domain-containing protein n=1 Tax=Fulvivirga aurantia TaxID=2529383 RepID=UPI0012BC676B|nr:Rossmann-like and DUF2520 domain-containing protein [Fulvivirga aurantia]MTI20213.1 DUF2520 domain-containing protein [Fulvivirga aurantia]
MLPNKVSFIGSGNLAWHLAPALDNAGYAVAEVFSQKKANAKALVNRLYQAEVKADLDFSESNSDIFIIAVSDDAIEEVAREMVIPDAAIVVHTSGASSIGALEYTATDNIGVFYPLQTFSKNKNVEFAEIPICIESNNDYTEDTLMAMAKAISKNSVKINSKHRKALHLAAVFACNFTNHCLRMSEDILKKEKLSFDLLKPLIGETINKSLSIGPSNAQTGPAKRHDFETLDKHLDYIEDEELAELYRLISQHIVDTYPLD